MPNTTAQLHPAHVSSRALRSLRLMFELAQADRPAHVGALAGLLGEAPEAIADYLLELEEAGFARADHARLTMAGLLVASRLPAVATPSRAPGSPAPRIQPPRQRARAPRHLPPGWAPKAPGRVSA